MVIAFLGYENVVVYYDKKIPIAFTERYKQNFDSYQCYKSYNLQSQNNIEIFFQTTTTPLGVATLTLGS